MNLQNLQTELLIMIFCFLDSYFLINTVATVCKRFNTIINCSYMWNSRVKTCVSKSLFVSRSDWKKMVYSFEAERFRWKNNGLNMNKYQVRTDGVHNIRLMNQERFCVSDGFRGRCLKMWNLQELVEPGHIAAAHVLVIEHQNAHDLPVTSITTSGTLLCSGGADTMIHLWELENSSFQRVYTAKCKSYVFCLSMLETVVAAGTVRFVSTFDTRNGPAPVFEMPLHRQAVTDVHIDEKHMISSGTDGKVSIYDRRANKVLCECTCPDSPNYINCMSCDDGFLFGGDSQGAVHLWDVTGNDFHLVESFGVGHDQFITGLDHSLGCVVSGGADGKLNVFSVIDPSVVWSSYLERYVTDLHYRNKVLVSVSNSDLITIWKPK